MRRDAELAAKRVGERVGVVACRRRQPRCTALQDRALEQATSREELLAQVRSPDTQAVAIDLIASENHIPRVLAARVLKLLVNRFPSA